MVAAKLLINTFKALVISVVGGRHSAVTGTNQFGGHWSSHWWSRVKSIWWSLVKSFSAIVKFSLVVDMSKQRISHCNKENINLLQELKTRVDALKLKPIEAIQVRKLKVIGSSNRVEVTVNKPVVENRTPKQLVCLKFEANYAAIPAREESKLVQFAIRKEAEDLKKASKKTVKRKIVPASWYNGSHYKTKKVDKVKCDKNL